MSGLGTAQARQWAKVGYPWRGRLRILGTRLASGSLEPWDPAGQLWTVQVRNRRRELLLEPEVTVAQEGGTVLLSWNVLIEAPLLVPGGGYRWGIGYRAPGDDPEERQEMVSGPLDVVWPTVEFPPGEEA